jgi:hypothetical protein
MTSTKTVERGPPHDAHPERALFHFWTSLGLDRKLGFFLLEEELAAGMARQTSEGAHNEPCHFLHRFEVVEHLRTHVNVDDASCRDNNARFGAGLRLDTSTRVGHL